MISHGHSVEATMTPGQDYFVILINEYKSKPRWTRNVFRLLRKFWIISRPFAIVLETRNCVVALVHKDNLNAIADASSLDSKHSGAYIFRSRKSWSVAHNTDKFIINSS